MPFTNAAIRQENRSAPKQPPLNKTTPAQVMSRHVVLIRQNRTATHHAAPFNKPLPPSVPSPKPDPTSIRAINLVRRCLSCTRGTICHRRPMKRMCRQSSVGPVHAHRWPKRRSRRRRRWRVLIHRTWRSRKESRHHRHAGSLIVERVKICATRASTTCLTRTPTRANTAWSSLT
jgi:hypothetical protein